MRQTATALAAILLIAACGGQASNTALPANGGEPVELADVQAQTEALNAWFERKWDEGVARSPMTQTYLGIRGEDYGKWDDPSMEAALEELEIQRANVAEMRVMRARRATICRSRSSRNSTTFRVFAVSLA